MDPDLLPPLILGVTITLSAAGVLIFRPLSKRLADLIELWSRDRQGQMANDEVRHLTDAVSRLTDRMESLEDRLDFTERMIGSLERPDHQARRKG